MKKKKTQRLDSKCCSVPDSTSQRVKILDKLLSDSDLQSIWDWMSPKNTSWLMHHFVASRTKFTDDAEEDTTDFIRRPINNVTFSILNIGTFHTAKYYQTPSQCPFQWWIGEQDLQKGFGEEGETIATFDTLMMFTSISPEIATLAVCLHLEQLSIGLPSPVRPVLQPSW